MTKDNNIVDLEKLTKSLQVVENVNSILQGNSLNNLLLEMTKEVKTSSSKHSNCFDKYNEKVENISTKLVNLKSMVTNLETSLSSTINAFSTTKQFHKKDFSSVTADIEKIPPVSSGEDSSIPMADNNTSTTINPIPIGLGIAATGIAGSAGAVVLDSINYTYKKPEEEHGEYEEMETESQNLVEEESELPEIEHIDPYHASRDESEKHKFYDE